MAETPLTEQGKNFIRKTCAGTGKSLLVGKSTLAVTSKKDMTLYNPNGILPYCLPGAISPQYQWESHAYFSISGLRIPIETNEQLGEAIIEWYNKYAKIYEMNANYLAAQAFRESAYKVFIYALTSTASGISQFTNSTVVGIILNNSRLSEISAALPNTDINKLKFTDDEINTLTKNVNFYKDNTAYRRKFETYDVNTALGKRNRPIMHQNMIDNPELMVKAQFNYMKYIASITPLASSALFGYSRGPKYTVKKGYTYSIAACKSDFDDTKSAGYENEGINYVYRIFLTLYNEFGLKHLNMNIKPSDFNVFEADKEKLT